ncbi:hypothetical protein NPIL_676931 [Nephila pilipes]|uniref:Reverse transcriptase/retrotransposon-derived protein RNase H-like domain-containing protein n=1 Tax=Nephila pilipes TaxID=299642 RepID=A0A8X6Q1Q9_NEPPI|nr:hypothetical protein NPIL_676931 [Nephila pilipes]
MKQQKGGKKISKREYSTSSLKIIYPRKQRSPKILPLAPPGISRLTSVFWIPFFNFLIAMERWRGRTVLVTGASAGIGAALCRELSRQGMQVVGCARNVSRIEELAEEEKKRGSPGSIHAIKCDLTQESETLSMFDEIRQTFGRLDVCINNAGLSHDASLLSGHPVEWKNMIDVNVLALCICTREAVRLMKESNVVDGQIIHISRCGGCGVLPIEPRTKKRRETEETRTEVSGIAILSSVVSECGAKGAKKNDRTPILWSEDSAAAFEKCKKDLAEATVLYHPSADASLAIVVDASDTAVGAALHQQTSKGWQPLAFFSKTLSPAQRSYSAYDRELLAAYMAIKYFRHMVEGRSFTLFTDHKPLVYAFNL